MNQNQVGDVQLILIATGSEVHIALAAAERLAGDGIKTRLISMPSWELFDAQPPQYRNEVLLPGVPRLSIEAGITWAWDHFTCSGPGGAIGVDHFGASAPYQTIYEKFGLSPEMVAEKALRLLQRS
jgi:transketolase